MKSVMKYKKHALGVIAFLIVVTTAVGIWLTADSTGQAESSEPTQGPLEQPGSVEQIEPIVYENIQYGFRFYLPQSWTGYSIVTENWEGLPVEGQADSSKAETGPIILIRHPLWTAQNPRQDIPIMVFNLDQWESMQNGEFHIGAAPVGPEEIGRNSEYVFALPARYNYAFPEGHEEVKNILEGNPLQPFDFGEMVALPSLGGISLGDSPEYVVKVLGSDYTETTEPDVAGINGEDVVVWSYERGIVVYIGQTSGKVLKVTSTSPDMKTHLGIKVGDSADTVLEVHKPLYEKAVSRHSDEVLEGWFHMGDGAVMIFDFDKSDGAVVNSNITGDSSVEEIILAYWKHFD